MGKMAAPRWKTITIFSAAVRATVHVNLDGWFLQPNLFTTVADTVPVTVH